MEPTRFGVLSAVAVAIVIVAALLFTNRIPIRERATQADATETSNGSVRTKREVPAGAREYRSAEYNFSILYPENLTVSEHSEGRGATTITFQNTKTVAGFQIFIVPYGEPQVSEERFKLDEPSGIRESLTPITIDGATGASFFSTNLMLGDTREVWFVHGGYLYEVTTLKSLDPWLGQIMQTWEFITK